MIHAWGLAWCFGFNALSYLAVLAGLFMIHLPHVATSTVRTPLKQLIRDSSASAAEGVRYLMRPGIVRDLLGLVTVGAVFGVATVAQALLFAASDVSQEPGYWAITAVGGTLSAFHLLRAAMRCACAAQCHRATAATG